jgi:hypothetical protein
VLPHPNILKLADLIQHWNDFSLSLRERAGVRGKVALIISIGHAGICPHAGISIFFRFDCMNLLTSVAIALLEIHSHFMAQA